MEEFNSADILRNQNRKKRLAFLEVGLFEISFVLIFIVVIFGTLNYFNILSLSTLYPNQLGFLPHKAFNSVPLPKTQLANSPSPTTPAQVNDVSAVSDVPGSGYNLTILDKNLLMKFLNDSGVWGKTYNDLANPVVLQNIEFHLSRDNQMPENLQKDQSGNPLYSYNLLFIDNTLKLYVYLYPNVLASENNTRILSNAVIIIVSQLISSGKGGKSMSQDEINKITTEFANKNFFRVQKGT